MIRFLQQDNKATKVVFAVIIGIVVISMVYYLVPGIMDATGSGGDPNTYASVREPGVIGKIFGQTVAVTQPELSRALLQQTSTCPTLRAAPARS
jgi:peptidyl-prolyl cis-trans isomerase D